MDQELFELCKEVYKRTKWLGGNGGFMWVQWQEDSAWLLEPSSKSGKTCHDWFPFYTSDYLLEKLKNKYPSVELVELNGHMQRIGRGPHWRAAASWGTAKYDKDTPLKALLKLVIALDDAGELR